MNCKITARKFQFPVNRTDTTEMDAFYTEQEFEFDPSSTALVLMDIWQDHPTRGFSRRAENCLQSQIVDCVQAAHLNGVLVVHANHGTPEHSAVPRQAADIDWPKDSTPQQWAEFLKQRGIKTVFYAGFASNWCILFRPEGVIETAKHNVKVILLRDASLGYETPETLASQWAHHVAVNMVDAQFGVSAVTGAWIKSLPKTVDSPAKRNTASSDQSVWTKPFEILRSKWGNIPTSVSTGEISSSELKLLGDRELLNFWDAKQKQNLSGEGYEVRGWYHVLYDPIVKGKTLLDIGCGLGLDSVRFAELGASVTFCDIDRNNLEIVERICKIKGLEKQVSFLFLSSFKSFQELKMKYDIVTAIGSLHHAPFSVIQEEVSCIVPHLNDSARWLQLAYPKSRWEKEGRLAFDRWGDKTNAGTPWTEWYDEEKLSLILSPHGFKPVLTTEFYRNQFIWFDWQRGSSYSA